jgi:sortase A
MAKPAPTGDRDTAPRETGWTRPQVNRQVLARRRVPYFERPKHPHDWRWWVGGFGRVLIATGLLMFAFVGYQLWGTGIQTAQAQDSLQDQFHELLAGTSTTTVTTPVDTDPAATDPGASSTTSTVPTAVDRHEANGAVLGKLTIPKMGLTDYYFVQGVGLSDLKKGPGHFKETPMPGQLGNAAIAGHRTTYGHPFYRLNDLEAGDLITVVTVDGTFVYKVTDKVIVSPADYGKVIPTRNPDIATLTLATCHPAYTARKRLVVTAVLVPEQSDPVMRPPAETGPATSEALPGEGDTIPGDSVPDTTGSTVTGSTVTGSTVTGTTVTGTTVAGATTATTVVAVGGDNAAIDDSFSQGWFSDSAGIPHAIGWGLVLASVTLGAYFVGRRFKRLYVCFLVGFVPFFVVLYFFFENVNRLLPPGL